MTTFSQLVDAAVAETKRPDMISEIVRYANQTIRELHADPERGAVIFFNDNYREAQVALTDSSKLIWPIPFPHLWQADLCVRVDSLVGSNGQPKYARRTNPGPHTAAYDAFYYRAQNAIVVGSNGYYGLGSVGSTISFAYYEYVRSHRYYDVENRPATWDDDYGWIYSGKYQTLDNTEDNEGLQEFARDVCSNWMLLRWKSMVEEGLRAKIYKRVGDQTRAALCYSLYQQERKLMYTSEVADLNRVYVSE